jgi:nucleoside-diphosphate-sugar epimerase
LELKAGVRIKVSVNFKLKVQRHNQSHVVYQWNRMAFMNLIKKEEAGCKEQRSVMILGGSGFIGTRLAALLKDMDVPVQIGDLRPSEAFPELSLHCDVRSEKSLREVLRETRTIVNLAAEHRDDVRPLTRYRETNVDGATHVCNAAREVGIQKIVFTSSAAVYGFQPHPVDENGPFEPFNEYGKTKLEAEGIYQAWAAEDSSRSLVIVRPTVVFGEGNRGNVYSLLQQIASGRFLMVGSGINSKSMAYVGNIAAFLIHILSTGPGIQIFNYVDGPDMTTNALVAHITRCMGKQEKVLRIPESIALFGGHVLDAIASFSGRSFSISAIRVRKFCENTQFVSNRVAQSGFTPPYSLSDGLSLVIRSEFRET